METYEDCWEMMPEKIKRLEENLIFQLDQLEEEISRLKSMSLFQRIFRWEK